MTSYPIYYNPIEFSERIDRLRIASPITRDEFVKEFPEIRYVDIGALLSDESAMPVTQVNRFYIDRASVVQHITREGDGRIKLDMLTIAAFGEEPSKADIHRRLTLRIGGIKNLLKEMENPDAKIICPKTFEPITHGDDGYAEYAAELRLTLAKFEKELAGIV